MFHMHEVAQALLAYSSTCSATCSGVPQNA